MLIGKFLRFQILNEKHFRFYYHNEPEINILYNLNKYQ